MAKTAGRQVEVGIGIETVAGTPVAAAGYFKWDSFSMQSMADKVLLNSARGIRNKTSNSMIIKKYGKGSLEFMPSVDILPYVLGMVMGTRSSGAASGESTIYDHTFSIQNANASMKTATLLVKQGGVQVERYSNCVVDSFDLTIEKDYQKAKIGVLSNFPDTGALTPSYVQDTMFSRNEMTAAFASTLTAAVGTFAQTTLTSDATAPVDASTIVINGITYTFKSALTGAAYEVFINTTAAAALVNLKKAINGTGTAGTDYGTGTLPNPYVVAGAITATTLIVRAKISGTTPNAYATTQAGTSHCTWTGATMNSGTPGTGANPTPLVAFTLAVNNNVQFDDAFLSGAATPIAGGFIAGPLEIKGSYTLQFADTTELLKYQQNTLHSMCVTSIGAGIVGSTVGTPEKIQFKFGDLVLTKAPIEYNLDGLVYLKQEFSIQYDATDLEMAAVVTNTYVGTNYQ